MSIGCQELVRTSTHLTLNTFSVSMTPECKLKEKDSLRVIMTQSVFQWYRVSSSTRQAYPLLTSVRLRKREQSTGRKTLPASK